MSAKFRDQVADLFKSNPNEWIDGMTIAAVGGSYAWRSRVSDCRKDLGMSIENRQRYIREHSAQCPSVQAWDVPGACSCGRPVKRTISEYRFVPAAVPSQPDLFSGNRGGVAA